MLYGMVRARTIPAQDQGLIRLLADRWWRDSQAMRPWAEKAKECIDFLEGRQWTAEQLAAMREMKRPALTFNKIAPLVRLILGYMRNNRTDIRYLPTGDGQSDDSIAEALTKVAKQISEASQLPWVDAEVFMDGISGGRGFWDTRLCFEENDLGEAIIRAQDPFATYLDSDSEEYDTNKSKRATIAKWACLDEIEMKYGPEVANAIRPFIGTTGGGMTWGGFPFLDMSGQEITPVRTFGQVEDPSLMPFADLFHSELIDPTRKAVRILDQQHLVTRLGKVFIDLETGDKVPVPDQEQLASLLPQVAPQQREKHFIDKALYHAQQVGNPITVDFAPLKRWRWSVMIGDLLVHDAWSPYKSCTITGYYPYFRRGMTRGMVDDLLDPQREVNKRRSAEIDMVTRAPSGGWTVHEDALTPQNEAKWKRDSAKPGFIGFWKGEKEPKQIQSAAPPTAMERLEQKGTNDLREISGINESALGQDQRVKSGRALEAQQRQAVIAVQLYMDNFARSKELVGRRLLEIVQGHYTEQRVFRILGEDGKLAPLIINQGVTDPMTGEITTRLNDITLGKYSVAIDETPLSASFASAQFDEMTELLEKLGPLGQVLIQMRPDLVVDLSSLPRKKEWMEALQTAAGLTPPPGAPADPTMPPGAPQPGAPAPGAPPNNVVPFR